MMRGQMNIIADRLRGGAGVNGWGIERGAWGRMG